MFVVEGCKVGFEGVKEALYILRILPKPYKAGVRMREYREDLVIDVVWTFESPSL